MLFLLLLLDVLWDYCGWVGLYNSVGRFYLVILLFGFGFLDCLLVICVFDLLGVGLLVA